MVLETGALLRHVLQKELMLNLFEGMCINRVFRCL